MGFAGICLDVLSWTAWTATSICLVFSFSYLYWKTTRNKRLIDMIPGYKDWPLVGDILHLNPDPAEYMREMQVWINERRSKKILKIKILETPWIFLFSASEVEKLLSSNVNISKSDEYQPLHRWLGMGLLTSTGKEWKSRRHMLTPGFHFSILQDYLVLINKHALNLKDKLLRDACDSHQPYDIFPDITLSTLDIICDTAMGVELDALNDGQSDYIKAMYEIKCGVDTRSRNIFHRHDIIFNNTSAGRTVNQAVDYSHKFTMQIIKERRQMLNDGEHHSTEKGHKPFLDLLIECRDDDGNALTDVEIREEVDTFMFEGHDTTSSAIAFAIHLLGAEKAIQQRCQEEIDEVTDSSRDMTFADLSRMTYLEWCIKETMRIFPPVPFFARALSVDTELGGHVVPKGTSVTVFTMSLHADPQVFPNPEKFDPTRFAPENCAQRHPYAYVPFSAGPRNCIGQRFAMTETKIIMATILKNFNIESTQKREELKVRPALIIQPHDGIKVKLTSRHN